MFRDDIKGRQSPAWLQSLLTRRYGLSPFGEPRYRLVWGTARFERSGGVWTDWLDGRVLRRRPVMRWVPKYPGEQCWLIERWQPASCYGTPGRWYASIALGGTVMSTRCGPIATLGDFPQFGDYEDIGARMYWYPTERHLVLAVDMVERKIANQPSTALGRALRRTRNAVHEQQRRDDEYDRLAADLLDDASPAFAGAPMIGYGGTHRPALVEMAEHAGIRQHPL